MFYIKQNKKHKTKIQATKVKKTHTQPKQVDI